MKYLAAALRVIGYGIREFGRSFAEELRLTEFHEAVIKEMKHDQ